MPRTKSTPMRKSVKAFKHKRAIKKSVKTVAPTIGSRMIVPLSSAERRQTFDVVWSTPFATDVGGFLLNGGGQVLSSALNSAPRWSGEIITNFDQFYVESMDVSYVPSNRYSKVATATSAIRTVVDWDDASVGSPNFVKYTNYRVLSADDPWELSYVVPRDIDAGTGRGWRDCANVAQFRGVFYADAPLGLTASTTYGLITFRFRVTARQPR